MDTIKFILGRFNSFFQLYRLYSIKWRAYMLMMKWKDCGSKTLWPVLRTKPAFAWSS
jgi:hypothetical protein